MSSTKILIYFPFLIFESPFFKERWLAWVLAHLLLDATTNAITASRMKIKNAEEVNSITGNFAETSKKYSRTALSGIHITIESGTTHKCSSESLGSGVEIAASGYRSQCWRDGDECANDEVWGVSA